MRGAKKKKKKKKKRKKEERQKKKEFIGIWISFDHDRKADLIAHQPNGKNEKKIVTNISLFFF